MAKKTRNIAGVAMTEQDADQYLARLGREAEAVGVAFENVDAVVRGATSARLIALPRAYVFHLTGDIDQTLQDLRYEAARMRGHALLKIVSKESGPFEVEPIDETQLQLLELAGLRILEMVDEIRRKRDRASTELAAFTYELHREKLLR